MSSWVHVMLNRILEYVKRYLSSTKYIFRVGQYYITEKSITKVLPHINKQSFFSEFISFEGYNIIFILNKEQQSI